MESIDTTAQDLFNSTLNTKDEEPKTPSLITDTTSLARILKYASIFTTNEGIYSHFFFVEDGIITTDGAFLFKSDIRDLPSATLPARNVIKFLSVCPEEQVRWSYGKEKASIIFKSGSYRTQITNTYVSEIPSPKELFGSPLEKILKQKDRKEIDITAEIVDGLQRISFCSVSDREQGKQEIKGVRIEKNGLFSTDAYGIASILMDTGITEPFTLPHKIAGFMIQYGLPPDKCILFKDHIVVAYPKILIMGLLHHYQYPSVIMNRILSFKPTSSIKLEDNDAMKVATLRRLSTSDGTTIKISPVDGSFIEFSITDLLGHKTSEVVKAKNNLKKAMITGLKYFRGGYKNTNEIQVFEGSGESIQLMFLNGNYRFTLLGKSA